MENKKRLILIVFSMFLIFNFYSVYAYLGLTPAKIETDFEPGLNFSVNFRVLTDPLEQKFKVYADGDFSEYVKFDKTNLTGPESFTIYVNLPNEAEKPGQNYLYIKIAELLEEGSGIRTRLEIGALIVIKVPYPGKYAEIKSFGMNDANAGEAVNFIVEVESLGYEDIYADADIYVYSNGELIDNFPFSKKTIKSQTSETFKKTVEEGYKSGVYNSSVIVNYGEIIKKERQFRIGSLFVDIINYSSEFVKGKINEFKVEIESKWNNNIYDVHAEVNITNNGEEVDYFKTPSIELGRWEKNKLKGFLNAEDLDVGRYKAKIMLFYENEINEKIVDINIVRSEINKQIFIRVSIGIVIFIGIVYFVLRKKIKWIK